MTAMPKSIPAGILCCTVLAALAGGCVDDREIVSPSPAPSIAPTTQWAGGVVRVTVDGVTPDGLPPRLSFEGEALMPLEVGNGWVDYRLPGTARGPVSLELDGVDPATFEVDVLGFRWVRPLGASLRGNLFVWPRTGYASLLALADDNTGVIQVLPAAPQTRYLVELPIFPEARSVGPTSDPDLVLLPTGWAEVWRLLPAPQVVDTLVVIFSRHAMLLGDSVYAFSGHHDISVVDPRVGWPSSYIALHEESQGTVISPSGRYGSFRLNGSWLGTPVFSAESGEPVFHVEALSHSDGVDFSPVGDTLYIAGPRRAEPRDHLVLAIDAATGEILDDVVLGERHALNIVRDQRGPWLFVMTSPANEPPALVVIDTRTMTTAGEVLMTQSYTGCNGGCEGAVAVGPDGVFFVTSGGPREVPAVVLAFDGWPSEYD